MHLIKKVVSQLVLRTSLRYQAEPKYKARLGRIRMKK